jgi:hypothetical protein
MRSAPCSLYTIPQIDEILPPWSRWKAQIAAVSPPRRALLHLGYADEK